MVSLVSKEISGYELIKNKIVTIDFVLKDKKFIFIKGYVLNPMHFPIGNAAVEITIVKTNCFKPQIIKSFVTFSESNGMYGISVPCKSYYSYIIKAFSP